MMASLLVSCPCSGIAQSPVAPELTQFQSECRVYTEQLECLYFQAILHEDLLRGNQDAVLDLLNEGMRVQDRRDHYCGKAEEGKTISPEELEKLLGK